MKQRRAYAIEDSDLDDAEFTPEQRLWCAVIERACLDAKLLLEGKVLTHSGGSARHDERAQNKHYARQENCNALKELIYWFHTEEMLGFRWICDILPGGQQLKEKFQSELFLRFSLLNVSGTYAQSVRGKLDQSLSAKMEV